jgi:hypothetical protein
LHKAPPPFRITKKSTVGKSIRVKGKPHKGKHHGGHQLKKHDDASRTEAEEDDASPEDINGMPGSQASIFLTI